MSVKALLNYVLEEVAIDGEQGTLLFLPQLQHSSAKGGVAAAGIKSDPYAF
jgi:hypothetical protein